MPVALAAMMGTSFLIGMFIPLGVAVVIPPWNFPLAILTGMTTAALVSGNTVVLKPSSDAAGIATMFLEACDEAGVPDGVLNFVTGGGSTVGNALVENPKTRLVAFTGSRGVGTQISEKAGRVLPGQIWIKRAILEMGGKDFILVDETADLEEAANGIVAATDVTGFGLLGHGLEMARASGARLAFDADALPLLPGALDLAGAGVETDGAAHNRRFVRQDLEVAAGVDPAVETLAHDPQTSGGLLAAVPAGSVDAVLGDLDAAGVPAWRVGHVEAGRGLALR